MFFGTKKRWGRNYIRWAIRFSIYPLQPLMLSSCCYHMFLCKFEVRRNCLSRLYFDKWYNRFLLKRILLVKFVHQSDPAKKKGKNSSGGCGTACGRQGQVRSYPGRPVRSIANGSLVLMKFCWVIKSATFDAFIMLLPYVFGEIWSTAKLFISIIFWPMIQ